MNRIPGIAFCCALALVAIPGATARQSQNSAESAPALPPYAELAGQVLASPIIVDATVREAIRLKGPQALNVPNGFGRFYIVADVAALIRGKDAIPTRVEYVADVPLDARGRAPKLKKQRVLLFARPVPGQPAQLQLVDIASQRPWNAPLDAMVRDVTRAVLAPDAPPEITGVGNAFHVPGTLPGEGETQIFLMTARSDPLSLQILRRPGQAPTWAVSLGEIVDDSAGPPARDTLLWYRLACGLPRALPDSSLSAEEPDNARIAREDYAMVLRALGPCEPRAY